MNRIFFFPWKTVFSELFSFEMFFALFLFVGVFKESPRLNWFPVDLTAVSFFASLFAGFWIIARKQFLIPRVYLVPSISMVLFCAWALLSLTWSPSENYGVKKAIFLSVFGFWSYFGGLFIIGPNKARLERFCWAIIILSIWITIEILALIFSGEILRDLDWGSQYLGQGRLIGLGVLSIVGMFFLGNIGTASKSILTLLIILLLIALLVLGGRGPFLATVLALGVAVFRGLRLTENGFFVRKNVIYSLLLIFGVLIWFFFSGNNYFNTTTLDRFWQLLSVGGEGSANNRIWFFGHALDFWQVKPIVGQGIGSFGILIGWGDVQVYPHNIILEILVELGIIGLALFGVLLFQSIWKTNNRLVREDPLVALVLMLVINTFFNAMVTSDLSGNRVLYAALGLLCGVSEAGRLKDSGGVGNINLAPLV